MKGVLLFRAWLDGRQPYDAGLELVQQHSTDQHLLAVLGQGENAFTRRKLRAEVQRLAEQEQLATTAPPAVQEVATSWPPAGQELATSTPAPASIPDAPTLPAVVPAELVQLRATRLAGFKRASYLKSRLELMATDADRLVAALEIKQLWRDNQKSWDDEKYFDQYGFLPPVAPPVAGLDRSNLAEVTQRRNTLRTYLSTAGRGTKEKRAAWHAEQLELDRILTHE